MIVRGPLGIGLDLRFAGLYPLLIQRGRVGLRRRLALALLLFVVRPRRLLASLQIV